MSVCLCCTDFQIGRSPFSHFAISGWGSQTHIQSSVKPERADLKRVFKHKAYSTLKAWGGGSTVCYCNTACFSVAKGSDSWSVYGECETDSFLIFVNPWNWILSLKAGLQVLEVLLHMWKVVGVARNLINSLKWCQLRQHQFFISARGHANLHLNCWSSSSSLGYVGTSLWKWRMCGI